MNKFFMLCLVWGGVLLACNAQKDMAQSTVEPHKPEAPLSISAAYYDTWVAGVEGGGQGRDYFFELTGSNFEAYQWDSVWVNGKRLKLTISPSKAPFTLSAFENPNSIAAEPPQVAVVGIRYLHAGKPQWLQTQSLELRNEVMLPAAKPKGE